VREWSQRDKATLIELIDQNFVATDIASKMGRTLGSILTYCGRHNIAVVKYSPEQQAIYDERARQREVDRNNKKVLANKARRVAKRAALVAHVETRPSVGVAITVRAGPLVSKTSPGYRKLLAPIGEMTKSELRAMLAEAVRNTAEASV
jgi:hypothetical protein